MKPEDELDSDEKGELRDDSLLAEAFHQVLERRLRTEQLPAEASCTGVDERDELDTALHAARLLEQFVRQVEEGSGVFAMSDDSPTKDYVSGDKESLPSFPTGYQVRCLLGEGTFGKVWLVDDLNLGIQVALKGISPQGGIEERSRALAVLQNEAKILGRLKHPNIVQVQGWRQVDDEHYLVMQYVPGTSLKVRLETAGPLNWRQAARYGADVAEALGHVHALGLIHRDIKPANLLWDEVKDEVLLTDFGLATWLAQSGAAGVAGTLCYMAPEAFEGQSGQPGDVYSLGATLFHLLTGEAPFPGKSSEEIIRLSSQGLPEGDPRCATIPDELVRVIRESLTPDPVRHPALSEFAAKLRGCLNRLLASSLPSKSNTTGQPVAPAVRVLIARLDSAGNYVPIATAERTLPQRLRNMVSEPAAAVVLRTGDRVRIEVMADYDGYLSVFNVGPTGDLNLLYPAPHVRKPSDAP